MRPFGFSTGALAYSDFQLGLRILLEKEFSIVEISTLRQAELPVFINVLPSLDVSGFEYVSVHAPSKIERGSEGQVVENLELVAQRHWPIVVHPDVVTDTHAWSQFGPLLLLENMDRRKQIGRTCEEMERVFDKLPEAGFCMDLGHSHQVDPTMIEAMLMLEVFRDKLQQIHLSEVTSSSRHDLLSFESILAFRKVAHLIPDSVPVVLETPVSRRQIDDEIAFAKKALPQAHQARVVA